MRLIDADSLIEDLEFLAKHEDSFRQSVILGIVHVIKSRIEIDSIEPNMELGYGCMKGEKKCLTE